MKHATWLIALVFVLLSFPTLAQDDAESGVSLREALTIAQELYGEEYITFEIEIEDDVNDVLYWQVRLYQVVVTEEDDDDRFEEIYIEITTGTVVDDIVEDDDDGDDDDDDDD